MDAITDPDAIARFEEKFIPEPNSGCWIWIGAISKNGYGAFAMRGMVIGAHQASFLIYNGALRLKDVPCHRCDFRVCVNPDHLFRGSQITNNRDRARKGRTARLVGQLNPSAKLTDRERMEIVRRLATGNVTEAALAKNYGVAQTTVSAIWRRWKLYGSTATPT